MTQPSIGQPWPGKGGHVLYGQSKEDDAVSKTHGTLTDQVRLYGRRNSSSAWQLRDFLKRSVVEFQWIDIDSEDGVRELLAGRDEVVTDETMVVDLPNGDRLIAPSLKEVAERLGFVTEAKLREYDVSIYGAGPAGLAAAVYAASEGLRTLLVEKSAVGGQAGTTSMIENYLGFPNGINGADLAERARQQAVKFGVELLAMQEGVKSEFHDNRIWTDFADGGKMTARANICATGVEWRRLGLPNENELLGRGIYYGAGASEAPLCSGEHVVVVGGGNSAGQAVMHLASHARHVTMLVRDKALAATMSDYLSTRILEEQNVTVGFGVEVTGLIGDDALEGVKTTDREGRTEAVETTRMFVAIGGVPNTEWASETDIVRDRGGYLVTGPDLITANALPSCWPLERAPYHLETSVPGSFAAGDVRARSIKRVATAAGEGAMAVAFVHRYLEETA